MVGTTEHEILTRKNYQNTDMEIAKALKGNNRADFLFGLKQEYESYLFFQKEIDAYDAQINFARINFFDKTRASAMNTKLTLTIEQTIIEKAKKYAHIKGRSLSDIVENYLKAITKEDNIESIDLTPIVKSLKGTFKAPKNIDYKKELSKRLTEKYL